MNSIRLFEISHAAIAIKHYQAPVFIDGLLNSIVPVVRSTTVDVPKNIDAVPELILQDLHVTYYYFNN